MLENSEPSAAWQSVGSFLVLPKVKGLLVRLPFYHESFRQLARKNAALWDSTNKSWAFKNTTIELLTPKLLELDKLIQQQAEDKKSIAQKFFRKINKLRSIQFPNAAPLLINSTADASVELEPAPILSTPSLSIAFQDNAFLLSFPYNETLIENLKLNRGQYLAEKKQWRCPLQSSPFVFQLTLDALKEQQKLKRNVRDALRFEQLTPYPDSTSPIYYFFDVPKYEPESDTFLLKAHAPLATGSVFKSFFQHIPMNVEKLKKEVFFQPPLRRKNLEYHFYYRSVHKEEVAHALHQMDRALCTNWSPPVTYQWSHPLNIELNKKNIGSPFIDTTDLKIYQILQLDAQDSVKVKKRKNNSKQSILVRPWSLSELLDWHAQASSAEVSTFFQLSSIDSLQFSSIIEAIDISEKIKPEPTSHKPVKRL